MDCKNNALVAKWSITKKMDGDGRVTFGNLGIVRTLEKEKVKEVRDRIIERRMEQGINVRNDKWECTQIENRAEQQCKEVSFSLHILAFNHITNASFRQVLTG